MGLYRFILEDPTGAPLGEVMNAHDRVLAFSIAPMPTVSFRVRLDNKFADNLLNDDLLLAVYRGTTIIFHGIVVSAEETADESGNRQIQVNAAGALWRLTKRLIPASRTEAGYSFNGTVTSIIAAIVNDVNAESFSGVEG